VNPLSSSFVGKAIIFSAPSGSGKTTIARHLLKTRNDLSFSVSACTRAKRPDETHGVDYYFMSTDEFREKINNNEFIEWEEVYDEMYYGTLKQEVERLWSFGKHIVFDVDVKGGIKLKQYFKEDALAIFVKPPSLKILQLRLKNRKTEDDNSFRKRIAKAMEEMKYEDKFDTTIINDDMNSAFRQSEEVVHRFLD